VSVRADVAVLPPGNFKKDATVRPSHGRPRGHRPIVRPSENVRVTTMPKRPIIGLGREWHLSKQL
jgi:hypothetical protein